MNANNSKYGYLYEKANMEKIYAIITMCRNMEDDRHMKDEFTYGYDLESCVAYEGLGRDLCGSWCNTVDPTRHCFVSTNSYEFYEFPHKSNKKGSIFGKFLLIAKNIVFGSYYVCFLTNKLTISSCGNILEHAGIYCEAELSVTMNKATGYYCCHVLNGTGHCSKGIRYKVFDSDDCRKTRGYNLTRTQMIKKYKR